MANNARDRHANPTYRHCAGELIIPTPTSRRSYAPARRQWCMAAFLAALMASPALGVTATGRVFLDQDGDGVAGANEPGLAPGGGF